jgi:hypothetical protein
MGWNGIGIGWPNASSSRGANLAYFSISERCNSAIPLVWTSQLINTNIYQVGNYVDGIDPEGNVFRWRLGEIVLVPGDSIISISGPTYISCEA